MPPKVRSHEDFEDLEQRGAPTLSLLRRLIPFFLPYWKTFALCGVLLLGTSFLALAGPLLLRRAIDVDIAGGDESGLLLTLGLYFGTAVCVNTLGWLHLFLVSMAGQRMMADLKMKLLDRLLGLSMDFFDRTPVGRIISRVENDVETLSTLFTQTFLSLLGNAVMFAGMVVIALSIEWRLSLVAFSILPLMLLLALVYSRLAPPMFLKVRRKYADVTSLIAECVQGAKALQLSNADAFARLRFRKDVDAHYRSRVVAEVGVIAFWNTIVLFEIVGLALVLWYGGMRALGGAITIGTLVLFIGYIRQLFGPVRALSDQLNVIQKAGASARRVLNLLDEKATVSDPESPKPWRSDFDDIEFRDVSFSYGSGKDVLKNVSFTVKRGERVAILGLTGAGKTTIANLLCRYYDVTSGTILVGGTDIRDIPQQELRRKIGLVLQDVFLFPGDVSSNIRMGREDLAEEMVRSAAKTALAHDFIEALPDGYASDLQERGRNLSAGQRQLLAFARAIAQNPEVLVLDEATSSVDGRTEELIRCAMLNLLENRTSLIIAHRLASVLDSDRVIVLAAGAVAECGTHSELIAAGGAYEKFFRLQFGEQPRATEMAAGGAK